MLLINFSETLFIPSRSFLSHFSVSPWHLFVLILSSPPPLIIDRGNKNLTLLESH